MTDPRDEGPHDEGIGADSANEADNDDQRIPSMALAEWGLLPPVAALGLHAIARWWFIRFNPLYFCSAGCVLTGVALVTGTSGGDAPTELWLFGVLQAYELSLIAAAGVLVHRLELLRPAVLLVMLEVVFLLDCTFRLETMAHLGTAGTYATAVWVLLTGVKLRAIQWALRLAPAPLVLSAAWAAAAGIALMIQTLAVPGADRLLILQATGWLGGALLLTMLLARPRLDSALGVSRLQVAFARRLTGAVLALLTVFFFVHVFSYAALVYLQPPRAVGVQLCTLLAVLAVCRRRQGEVFAYLIAAALLGTANPNTFTGVVLALGAVSLYHVLRHDARNLAVVAAFAAYVALWSLGAPTGQALPPWPGVWRYETLVLVALLAFVAWRLRCALAAQLLVLGTLVALMRADWSWLWASFGWLWEALRALLPETARGVGLALLGLGFAALGGGLAVNWRLRRDPLGQIREPEDTTSAGVPVAGAGSRAS